MCGIAGVVGLPIASGRIIDLLINMEQRGERGAGVVSYEDGEYYKRLRIGPVSHQFRGYDDDACKKELPGNMAIGHCRYATKGNPNAVENVQPLFANISYGPIAIAHNGTLINVSNVKKMLNSRGAVFKSTSDSEIFLHLISYSVSEDIEKAILSALYEIKGSYSLLIMAQGKIFAIRDIFGNRPLSIGKLNDGYLIASETFPLDQMGASFWRDIKPGEMVVFEIGKEPKSIIYGEAKSHFCPFEPVYFMHPRSRINSQYVEDYRYALGKSLAKKIKSEVKNAGIDSVIGVPDSGTFFATGLANGLGLPYHKAFFRTRNPRAGNQNRSFTATSTEERIKAISYKLHLRPDKITSYPLIADDSIVRANTSKIVAEMMRKAGAKKVAFAAGFPPIIHPCYYGMDFPTPNQLVASGKTIAKIKKFLSLDKLFYLSEEDLLKVTSNTIKCGICKACFSGEFLVPPEKV